jgi:calcineurin-like phosphoesterase family protein
MMNDNAAGALCFSKLKGKIHIITGNHDTPARIEIYKQLGFDVQDGKRLSYKKKNFILSHEPVITSNGNFKGWRDTINIHGHTHQTSNFTEGYPLMYHAGVDSHNGYPVLLDDIIDEVETHWKNLGLKGELR